MITKIKISHKNIGLIRNELNASKPYEACGMLIGDIFENMVEVNEVMPMCKTKRSKLHFELDPNDFRIAQDYADKIGKQIVGIYHTHPFAPAVLSTGDEIGMENLPLVWLVAGVDEVKAYAWDNGVQPVEIQEY